MMVRSLKVADGMKQKYAIVTYDLAVAQKAYAIQSLKAPAFDRLIILLGNFHLEMAFFGALGTKEAWRQQMVEKSPTFQLLASFITY